MSENPHLFNASHKTTKAQITAWTLNVFNCEVLSYQHQSITKKSKNTWWRSSSQMPQVLLS